MGKRLTSAVLFDSKKGEEKTVASEYFEFGYDKSKIQKTGEIVLEALFRLDAINDKATLLQKAMDDVKRRNEEQPIGVACSGCIFRNIEDADAQRLFTPNLTTSTGYIIEKLGLKGQRIGGAQISEKHANYILNVDNARADDVLKLIDLVKKKAKKELDLNLVEEIFYIGDFGDNT